MSETASKPIPNLPEYSVSEIAQALKRTVEDTFPFVRVRGEISKLTVAASGHVYFDLKDDKAVINAIIWKQSARLIKLRPEQGLEVICTGRITTYPGSSRYQIIVELIELAGAGALMAMLEERKKKLAAEGLFAVERKKTLPFLPEVIGLVTSATGAVLRDIMHRLDARFPRRVVLWAVAVQGERAASEIAAAIRGFNTLEAGGRVPRPDVLIVGRGGGSLEDLMAFNEEIVIRAVADSVIPVISAVGHETDTTLIDFAADVRAPTPTAAAEMAVPVLADLLEQSLDLERRLLRSFSKAMSDRRTHLSQLARVLPRPDALFAQPRQRLDVASDKLTHALSRNVHEHRRAFAEIAALLRPRPIRRHISACRDRSDELLHRMERCFGARLERKRGTLEGLSRVLDSISYKSVLARGFVLVRGHDGTIRRRASQIEAGSRLAIVFSDGERAAVATSEDGPARSPPKRPSRGQASLF